MGIFNGNPKEEPMHYGEVYAVWTYLLGGKSEVALYETLVNHTGDEELRELIEEAIQSGKEDGKDLEVLLKENGVALPPAPPGRPEANLEDIPAGARMLDPEIGAFLSMNTAKGLVTCSTIMGQSIREDIAAMFGKFHVKKAKFGLKVLRLNKEKGWIMAPPLHVDVPEK